MMEENRVFDPMPEEPLKRPSDAAGTGAAAEASSLAATASAEEDELREARGNMICGCLWCVGGLAFSFLSYYFTKAGGHYAVASGAIIWGAVQASRGLVAWLCIAWRNGRFAAFVRMCVAAVCILAALVYLSMLSVRLVNGPSQLTLLEHPQTLVCEPLGVRLTIPAGYTAFEEKFSPETDTTYARYFAFAVDGEWEIDVDGVIDFCPPEVERLADMQDFCLNRNSYYDGGILQAAEPYTFGGVEMLRSRGFRSEYPGYVFWVYDFLNGRSLVSVGISYPSDRQLDSVATRSRMEELLEGIAIESTE